MSPDQNLAWVLLSSVLLVGMVVGAVIGYWAARRDDPKEDDVSQVFWGEDKRK